MRASAAVCALLSIFFAKPAPQPPLARTLRAHFDARDRETGRYQYVPLDVSADAQTLTIGYRYSGDKEGASVIDLGLFEPGPLTIGTPAFRGYSGGAQRTITVGRAFASPGYRSGALPAGRWHVLLGLYKVAPEGVDVEIDVTEMRDDRSPTTPVSEPRPDRAAPNADTASTGKMTRQKPAAVVAPSSCATP